MVGDFRDKGKDMYVEGLRERESDGKSKLCPFRVIIIMVDERAGEREGERDIKGWSRSGRRGDRLERTLIKC